MNCPTPLINSLMLPTDQTSFTPLSTTFVDFSLHSWKENLREIPEFDATQFIKLLQIAMSDQNTSSLKGYADQAAGAVQSTFGNLAGKPGEEVSKESLKDPLPTI